jgi:hypothetical protein
VGLHLNTWFSAACRQTLGSCFSRARVVKAEVPKGTEQEIRDGSDGPAARGLTRTFAKPDSITSTERGLLNKRELSRAALRSYLIAFAGVIRDANGSIRKLATGGGQAVIEALGG